MEKKRQIPVVITEDHHEVLPHIYRRIGSKLLPFSHITLLHLDSHPDLLIPIDMPADHVFNTQLLYQTMSIENWIMPAVYAGHIDHVIWLKPPWCEQISDKQTRFYVGKCSDTGRIRLSSTENYFLSEALFVPEEKLLNKKAFCLTVLTLQPENWQDLPIRETSVYPDKKSNELDTKEDLTTIGKSETIDKDNHDMSASMSCTEERLQKGDNSASMWCTEERLLKGDNSASMSCAEERLQKGDNSSSMSCSEERLLKGDNSASMSCAEERLLKGDNSAATQPGSLESHDKDERKRIHTKDSNITERICGTVSDIDRQHCLEKIKSDKNSQDVNCPTNYIVPKKKTRTDSLDDSANVDDITRRRDAVQQILQKLDPELEKKHIILDIDLDFFSTMNPFRGMLTEFQYNALKRLYRFTPPKSSDPKLALECLKRREEQLTELKSAILTGESNLSEENQDLLTLLLEDIDKTGEVTGNVMERELLHEAGCTCDDTELPHHISSEEQIQELTICMEQLLTGLPPPDMITIARSSLDDYCPPEQVEFIQDLVVENLNNVYDQLSVQKDYDIHQEETLLL